MKTDIKPYKNSIRQQNSYIESGFYGHTTIQKNLIILSIYTVQHTSSKILCFNKKILRSFLLTNMPNAGGWQYELIDDAIQALMDVRWSYTIENSDGTKDKEFRQWVTGVSEKNVKSAEGKIVLKLTDETYDNIKATLRNYTIVQIANQFDLKGIHATKFYDLLKREQTKASFTGDFTFEIDYLKECFNVVDKYDFYKDFKKYVLIKSLNEINEKTDLNISTIDKLPFIENKIGKAVKSITISYSLKKDKNTKDFNFELLEKLVQNTRDYISNGGSTELHKATHGLIDNSITDNELELENFTQISMFEDDE